MRILIIEDEHYAAKRLQNLILEELPDAKIVGVLDTVQDSVEWLSSHIEPHLIFMDIQLADGLSFQIFEKIKVACPIIFTTAYDEYALNAFKVNSIDYLLKPIEDSALQAALKKYQQIFPANSRSINWENIMVDMFDSKDHYKQRFLIKSGSAYAYLVTKDIKFLYSEDGLSFAVNEHGKKFHIDNTLDKIEKSLDPKKFYRISRKYIIGLGAIHRVHAYFNQRLKIETDIKSEEELVVARERVKDFKNWLDS